MARSWEEMRTSIADHAAHAAPHLRDRAPDLQDPRGPGPSQRLCGAGGRLLDGRDTAGGSVNLRVPLSSVDDIDDEAGVLRRAYDATV